MKSKLDNIFIKPLDQIIELKPLDQIIELIPLDQIIELIHDSTVEELDSYRNAKNFPIGFCALGTQHALEILTALYEILGNDLFEQTDPFTTGTLLHSASLCATHEVVKFLLEHMPAQYLTKKDQYDRTAYDVATQTLDKALLAMLLPCMEEKNEIMVSGETKDETND